MDRVSQILNVWVLTEKESILGIEHVYSLSEMLNSAVSY